MSHAWSAYTPKSNTRKRMPGTNCTEIVFSCIGFRSVRASIAAIAHTRRRHTFEKQARIPGPRMQRPTQQRIPDENSREYVIGDQSMVQDRPI
eukprot:1610013-Rhodomonas_salina.2